MQKLAEKVNFVYSDMTTPEMMSEKKLRDAIAEEQVIQAAEVTVDDF